MKNDKENKKLKEIEYQLQYEDDTNEIPPKEVFTFNELRSCADLYRMYKKGILEIQPVYQRDFVWSDADKTRFVDSLLKRLPIPSLCFSQDAKTNRMQVIDGLQRMDTIRSFFDNSEWRLSNLDDIDSRLRGKTIKEITDSDPEVVSEIENFALPVTLLRCDYEKLNHIEYVFTIFRRLNTGGLKLTNQEIRNAIFSGTFNDFLRDCNKDKNWASLLKKTTGQKNTNDRFKSIEVILKFFAFFDKHSKFKPGLSNFLNEYMKENRSLSETDIQKKKDLFDRTIHLALETLFKRKPVSRLNNATFDAVMFGIAKNIDYLEKLLSDSRGATIKTMFKEFSKQNAFSPESLSEGIYNRQKVAERFSLATSIFSKNDKT